MSSKNVIPLENVDAAAGDQGNNNNLILMYNGEPPKEKDVPYDESVRMASGEYRDADDEQILKAMGYKPVLFRGLDWFMNFAFGFTEVAVLPSVCLVYYIGLAAGGPATVIWGFLVQFAVTYVISRCMAEICAAYPSAGSVYHWTGQLVGPKWAPLASYFCGWTNFLGNSAGDASFANGWAAFLSSSLTASGSGHISIRQQVGVSVLVLLIWSLLNGFRIDGVGWINNLAAVTHAASIIVIIVTILVLTPKYATGEFVFSKYYNDTNFTGDSSFVVCIGLTAALFSFAGYEASAHMAEETGKAREAAPGGLVKTVLATGWGGLVILLALLFCTTNIESALNGLTGVAAIDVMIEACGRTCGSGLSWLVCINLFFAGISSVTVTGRITWALTRDRAFPFSEYLQGVHPVTKSPLRSIMMVFFWDSCLLLLPLNPGGGLTAFFAVVGLTTVGFQVSYAVPILCKLLCGRELPGTSHSLGKWSVPMGILSVCWLLGTSIFFLFPTEAPVNSKSMNYLVVVCGGCFFVGAVYWLLKARYHFRGPARGTNDTGIAFGAAEPEKGVEQT